jgi:conjugal transfer pilus assembly protein TraW
VNCKISFLFPTIFVVFGACPAFGVVTNLGVIGDVYQVVEPDIAAELQQRAEQNHIEEDEFLERVKTYQPEDLHHLPRATEDRTFLVDTTYTLDHDLVDGNGKIIYPRGFTFNPLDYVSFPGGLLVIDWDDPSQIKWFWQTPYANDRRVRLLLAGGYAYKAIEQLKRSVFYLTDEIAERLQLAAAPSLILQKDTMLQVREFHVPEEENDAAR